MGDAGLWERAAMRASIWAEEPEGQGLDYLVCRLIAEKCFALRWAHFDGVTVKRNHTQRTKEVQEQQWLFGAFDETKEGMPVVTMGYQWAYDYTEAGMP
jgi:hypothetical protein